MSGLRARRRRVGWAALALATAMGIAAAAESSSAPPPADTGPVEIGDAASR